MEKYKMAIYEFVDDMKYLDNEHVLGVLFYGSYLTGLNHKNSDIDIHVIFDDSDKKHLIRGSKYYHGIKIEYFEKPISDLYLSINNDFDTRNVAWLSIIGTSKVLFDKTGQIESLQQYAINKFSSPLPKLDDETAREYVSIINNRMEKLEACANKNSPDFTHLYHLTIEKIRKFYHNLNGLAKVNTTKVYRVYTDEEYRKAYSGYDIPEQSFVDMYLDAISDVTSTNTEKLEKVKNLFNYTKKDIQLGDEYRILIKTRNK